MPALSYSFNKNGELIGKHRKLHLFDVDIKNKIRFKESDFMSCGSSITILDTEFCKIGVLICHDIRFPEIFTKMVLEGVKIIVAPAAFNMVTGPYHCEVTSRARAVDNQIYFIAACPARDIDSAYVAYGHSFIVNPWGDKIAEADENECIIYGDINLDFVEKVREELPLLKQRRPELY
ncbi:MAG: nitrilase-related carbon-nitrogen hydrolase [Actinomycetota bacterium]